jgi:MiaB-like tRNA modifying enzyme
MKQKIYIETYGCSSNQADSEALSGLLSRRGFRIVDDVNKSDINIILTCIVKTPTSDRMAYRIERLARLNKPLVVTGCMPEVEYERIKSISQDASLISTNHMTEIPQAITEIMNGQKIEMIGKKREIKVCLPKIRKNPLINITQICSGCRSSCAYCCVRLAKGSLFSYPKDMITEDIKKSLKDGCKEIWITSQDCSCYGLDIETDLAKLLDEIVKIKGRFLIRVGMMNPKNTMPILKDMINVYKNPNIYKFAHIPVQSGSDKILKSMNRGYTLNQFKKIISQFRKQIPDITLSTDVIAGFPGETEKDFQKTINLLNEIKPDIVNISKFGARPGTKAAKMKQVNNKIIKERSVKIGKIVKKISEEKNKKWIGWKGEIFVNEFGKESGQFIGRNLFYKPVLVCSKTNLFGKFANVKITGSKQTHLIGELAT